MSNKQNDIILELLQELAAEVSNNQHELEHDGLSYSEARIMDDGAIQEAYKKLKEYFSPPLFTSKDN